MTTDATPDVSVIYVNWKSTDEILESVDSIRRLSSGTSREIIVVDNDSGEDLSRLEAEPDIKVIRSPKNGGFGAGCNIGVAASRGRYLLFLNPDTVLQNDAIGIMKAHLESHCDSGGCGAKILNSDGSVNYNGGRRVHSMVNDFLEHSSLCIKFPRIPFIGRPYYGRWDHNSTRPVGSLCGACMLFRRELFEELGGFDERFFMYCEEVDLCCRAWEKGREIYYVHDAVVLHKCSKSSEQYYPARHNMFMQFLDSEVKYFHKHFGPAYCWLWRKGVGFIYWLKYIRKRRREDLEKYHWGFSGV